MTDQSDRIDKVLGRGARALNESGQLYLAAKGTDISKLAASEVMAYTSIACSLRVIAESLAAPNRCEYVQIDNIDDSDEDPRVQRCGVCKCCVGTYMNYKSQWFCHECSDGDLCPRSRSVSKQAADQARAKARLADDAVAESNRAHTAHVLTESQRTDLVCLRLLLSACNRMRDDWSEGSNDRRAELWRDLHARADEVFERYGALLSLLKSANTLYTTTTPGVTVMLPPPRSDASADYRHHNLSDCSGAGCPVHTRYGDVPHGAAPDIATSFHTEPDPQGGGESVTDAVIRLLGTRRTHGTAKYGTELTTNNGRNPLKDLQEELADALCYTTQALMQQHPLDRPLFNPAWVDRAKSNPDPDGRYIHLPPTGSAAEQKGNGK